MDEPLENESIDEMKKRIEKRGKQNEKVEKKLGLKPGTLKGEKFILGEPKQIREARIKKKMEKKKGKTDDSYRKGYLKGNLVNEEEVLKEDHAAKVKRIKKNFKANKKLRDKLGIEEHIWDPLDEPMILGEEREERYERLAKKYGKKREEKKKKKKEEKAKKKKNMILFQDKVEFLRTS